MLDTYLLYIEQLELYQFMKIINMFKVEIPPPEKKKINVQIYKLN